jgi:periplasmic divalent cation tolerance protein
MVKMVKFIQIFTTTSKKTDALKIASSLIDGKLAACVQIVCPIQSTYTWKNKKEITTEWLCVIKSKSTLYKKVEELVKKIHPYELPEITYSNISGNKKYLDWIENSVR